MSITWRQLLVEVSAQLGDRNEARWLCEEASGFERAEWLDVLDVEVGQRAVARLDAMVARRIDGVPLAYVVGHSPFRYIDLMVDNRVLIPRPETEEVVERAVRWLADHPEARRALDLGTGSGAIGLSLAAETVAEVLITDSSSRALDVARANIAGLPFGAGPRVSARLGSWYDAVQPGERFDLIVSNPPYLALDDPEVAASVVDHEPAGALFAGADGLSALRVVLSGAPDHLVPGGAVLCEIGHRQGDAVRAIAHAAGLQVVEVGRDLAGRDRWILAVSPSYASGTAT